MTAPSVVRIATEADRNELWRLILEGGRENLMFPVAHGKVDWWFTRLLRPDLIPEWDTGPRGAFGVIGPIGELEGVAMVSFGNYWYTNERHLEEFVVYVDPECRQSGHAKALVEWMKHQSVLTGLPLLSGVLSNHRTEAKVRLYERYMPKVGAFFCYNGKGSVQASSAALMA